jgi:hypothetical protein
MLERLKMLLMSPDFWKAVVGLFILAFRMLFPDLPVTDDMVMKAFSLFLLIILGINITEMRAVRNSLLKK